jgi:hypothetical protein
MKKVFVNLVLITIVCAAVSACRGRNANPIQVVQDRDHKLSCEEMQMELLSIQRYMQTLRAERSQSNVGNVAAGVGSLIFLPAIAFLDLSKAEKVEIEAYKSRYEHLQYLMVTRKCNQTIPPLK